MLQASLHSQSAAAGPVYNVQCSTRGYFAHLEPDHRLVLHLALEAVKFGWVCDQGVKFGLEAHRTAVAMVTFACGWIGKVRKGCWIGNWERVGKAGKARQGKDRARWGRGDGRRGRGGLWGWWRWAGGATAAASTT